MRPAAPRSFAPAVIAAAALGLLAPAAYARPTGHEAASAEAAVPYKRVMEKEAQSQQLCEADPTRVFVSHRLGTECIAYIISRGYELQRRAVFYMEGDIPKERMTSEVQAQILERHRKSMQAMADRFGMPFIALSRPGVLGSSGNHGWRRRPAEALTINAAVDAIKARHGFDTISLAGQSGGATMAASLLTLGRKDIACAVLGSGNLAVVDLYLQRQNPTGKLTRDVVARSFYDPALHIGSIARNPLRRVIVIGDPEDSRTPFPQQQRFAERLQAAGHHAYVITIAGAGPESHGASYAALPAAGMCAQNMSDSGIASDIAPSSRAMAATKRAMQPTAAAQPEATATR